MDFVEGLMKSQYKSIILVVVDRLTKYTHFMALSHSFLVQVVAQLFVDHMYKLHGNSYTITNDRGMVFLNNFWYELFNL